MTVQRRSYLLLQGPCTPFSRRLAKRLLHMGHQISVVNFCGGDSAYRWGLPAHTFRAPLEELPAYLEQLWQRHGITDQLAFGDQRPVHRTAIERASRHGIRTHVFEEGYFRPFWITMERDGVNGHSLLPRDPDWYHEAHARLGRVAPATRFRSAFRVRVTHDVLYHLASASNPVGFPHYRNHAPVTAPVEYAGYVRRFLRLRLQQRKAHDTRLIDELARGKAPYFVLPLQLDSDAQIRTHSPYAGMREVIKRVMTSFAENASGNARLVIKNHPLDMGLVDYPRLVASLARQYAIEERIDYLETGNLDHLLSRADGMVTVNSTAGLVALEHGCPTYTLSDPIYRMPGLTAPGALNAFWREPLPPEQALFTAFRNTLLHTVQLNGGFYCRAGTDLAVDNASRVLESEQSALEALLACQPLAA